MPERIKLRVNQFDTWMNGPTHIWLKLVAVMGMMMLLTIFVNGYIFGMIALCGWLLPKGFWIFSKDDAGLFIGLYVAVLALAVYAVHGIVQVRRAAKS